MMVELSQQVIDVPNTVDTPKYALEVTVVAELVPVEEAREALLWDEVTE